MKRPKVRPDLERGCERVEFYVVPKTDDEKHRFELSGKYPAQKGLDVSGDGRHVRLAQRLRDLADWIEDHRDRDLRFYVD